MVEPRLVKVLRRAEIDLVGIWKSVARDNPVAADRMVDVITDQIARLSDFPNIGKTRDDIRPGFRFIVADPYVVLFRVTNKTVEIVRVIHGARDFSKLRF